VAADPAPLVLLGKPDCGLCDKLREVALPVARELGLALVERDVRDDPELERRYLFEIPVLLYRGEEVVRHRVTAADLRLRLLALGLGAPRPK
jgi:thiol-disulfide isomerase/thioredoxin